MYLFTLYKFVMNSYAHILYFFAFERSNSKLLCVFKWKNYHPPEGLDLRHYTKKLPHLMSVLQNHV